MNFLPAELPSLVALALVGICALAWFYYFESKDPRDTRRNLHRAMAIVGGIGSAGVALLLFDGLSLIGLDVQWEQLTSGPLSAAIGTSLMIGAVEEFAKMLSVVALAILTGRVQNRFEGLLCAACAGIGFASAETMVHVYAGGISPMQVLARLLASPLTHAVFAVPWGIGLAAFVREKRWTPMVGGFVLSMASHALYDFFVGRVSSYLSAAVVLLLWLLVIHQAPALLEALRVRRRPTPAPMPLAVMGSEPTV